MPINNRLTNAGRPLKNHYYGGDTDTIREIPPEFRAALDLTIIELPLPWDQDIIPLSDTVIASKAEQKVTSEWIRRTTYKPPGPIQLVEKATNRDKQVVTRTRNFKFQGDTVAVPGPFIDVETKNLGNLHFIENIENAGSVFPDLVSSTEMPDVLPTKWRALIPIHLHEETFTGNVTDPPVLGPAEFSRTEHQEDVFNLRRSTKSFAEPGPYPIDLFEEKMTPDQQVETIRERLSNVTQHLIVTPTMVEGEITALGDGRSIMRTGTTPEVFRKLTTSKEKLDVTPEVFRAALPIDEKRETFTGQVVDPQVLGTNELYRQEVQDTEFNMTRTTRKRVPVGYPAYAFEYKLTPEQQLETVTNKLDLGLQTLVPSGLMLEGDVRDLGNGTSVLRTGTVPSVFPKLTASKEKLDRTPEVFRAAIPLDEKRITIPGIVTDPQILGTNELFRQETQDTEFNLTRTTRKRVPLSVYPVSVIEYGMTPAKVSTTITSTLDVGLQTIVPDFLTMAASVTDLGDGRSVKKVEEADWLFQEKRYVRERPVVTPSDFQARVQEKEFSYVGEGSAFDPTLGPGQIRVVMEDLTDLTWRVSVRELDSTSIPAYFTNVKTNQYKQQVNVTRWLDYESGGPGLTPTPTLDVEYTHLGDGTALTIYESVDSVFEHKTTSIEIPDLIPEVFRALLPTYEKRTTFTGIVTDPQILGTGELSRSETQNDVFNLTRTVRTRGGITYPQDVVLSRKTTEEYGGEITRLRGYLDVSEPAVESGYDVVSSEVKNLGNGTWFRQTEKLDTAIEWPELIGTEVDPRTGIVIGIKRKVVPAGTTGGVGVDGYVDVKPIDKWRSIRISSKLDPATLPASTTWETTVEHRFPNTLLSLAWVWAAASAPFSYEFDMDLETEMLEGYAGPCRARVTESYSNGPPGAIITPTIFCPKGHTVGFAWAYAADPSSECGSCVGITKARARTWSIPPSLHDAITIAGGVTLIGGTFTDTLPATSPTGLPAAGTLIVKACEVERWRFGIFLRRLTEIYVPAC